MTLVNQEKISSSEKKSEKISSSEKKSEKSEKAFLSVTMIPSPEKKKTSSSETMTSSDPATMSAVPENHVPTDEIDGMKWSDLMKHCEADDFSILIDNESEAFGLTRKKSK